MLEGVVNVETQRFRVNPVQSNAPTETRAKDPTFWNKKPPTNKSRRLNVRAAGFDKASRSAEAVETRLG